MRWYRGWNVIGVCMVTQALLYGIGVYAFTLMVLPWVEEFGVSRREIMVAVMFVILGMGAYAPAVGWAADRMSIRGLMCAGAAAFAIGLCLVAVASSFWQIVAVSASLIAGGIALGGATVGQTLAVKWFRERRGLALGVVATGTSIGGFLAPVLVSELLLRVGWRHAYLFCALLVACAIPLVWLVVRNSPEHAAAGAGRPYTVLPAVHNWTTRSILSDRSFVVAAIVFLVPGTITVGLLQNLGPLAGDLGYSPRQAAYLITVLSATMIGGKLLLGILTDHCRIRTLYWLAMTALGLCLLILLFETRYASILVASALLGFATGGFLPLMAAVIGDRFGAGAFGHAMGLLFALFTLNSFGSVITAWIRDTTGSYGAAFTTYLAVLLPTALIILLLPSRRVQSE